jgi:oligopeptide transport system substrate-binding protein
MGRAAAAIAVMALALAAVVVWDRPAPPADLTWIEPQDIHTLDPQRMSFMQDLRIASALYEGLVRWDTLGDGAILPAAASSWSISGDGLVYTFELDPAGRWSNGDPVVPEDFVYAWQRALMPDTAAKYASLFYCIRGAEEFLIERAESLASYAALPAHERTPDAARALRDEADRRFRRTVGVEATGPRTLRVTLRRPTPHFLDLCAFGPFLPVHRPTVEAWTDTDPATGIVRQRHGWTKPGRLIGNGPYTLRQWRFKRDMRLERSPSFRDPSLARSGSILLRMIEDQNTSIMAFGAGGADWHTDVDVAYIGDLLEQKRRGERDDIHALPSFGTCFWAFNCTERLPDGRPNPFADPRVRRAMALAVDKQRIIDTIRRSGERAAGALVPPGSIRGYTPPGGLPFDPQRARRELADAGWSDRHGDGALRNERGERFPVVELLVTPTGPHRDVALALGRMWESALGVRTRIAVRESKVFRGTLASRDYMMARGVWFGDYPDPMTFHDLHRTGDGNNHRGFSDERYDALLRAADDEPDPAARLRILEEAERYLFEEAVPVIPIWHYNHFYMFRPPERPDGSPNPGGLRGISTHPRLVQYPFLLHTVRQTERTP